MSPLLRLFFNRRMAAMLALGFASGLPALLVGDNLQLWLKRAGVSNTQIGLFALIGLPYVLKFLWAPLLDRYVPPILGRRRGWLLIWQVALIGAILAMAMIEPGQSLWMFAAAAMLIALLSASQDIAADAYRVDVLPENERGPGTAVWVGGYRIAMIAIGAGALMLVGAWGVSWRSVYLISAALMCVGLVATLLAPEPPSAGEPPPTLAAAVIEPLDELLMRPRAWAVLLFVILFRLPDALAGQMTLPFMKDIGIAEQDIGAIRQGLGLAVTIGGTFLGGVLVAKLGLWPSLWVFGLLQAASNLGFWLLAQTGAVYGVMVGVIVVENLCAGLVVAGFTAFLMAQCNPRFSATQYAVLASLMQLTKVLGGAATGYLATKLGWSSFFLWTIFAGLPGMALIPWLQPRRALPMPGLQLDRSVEGC